MVTVNLRTNGGQSAVPDAGATKMRLWLKTHAFSRTGHLTVSRGNSQQQGRNADT